MKIAIILYPGSNCAEDIKKYFEYYNNECFYIWHKESDINKFCFELLVIPGGFAFGDRDYTKATNEYTIKPGKMALQSPVSNIIKDAANRNISILGICNGFQILTRMKLLPGELKLNTNQKFTCTSVYCNINLSKTMEMDVANSFGNYQCDSNELKNLQEHKQIFLTYNDENYNHINGSKEKIGGVYNKKHTILGMMPHPERRLNNSKFYELIQEWVNENKFKHNIKKLMLSEHISYKSTKQFLKYIYTEGDHVVQGPGENAGIVDIGNNYCLAIRIESHNHPIYIDPYNGAATGTGGIMRDIFTMGARPVAICDFLSFGTDDKSELLLKESVRGISDYGNCFGVANVGGKCIRDPCYNLNPLLNVACIGIVKKENIVYGNALNEGSVFIYVGSKTGSEGIHGATMASNSFSSDNNVKELKKNIQTGDPFLEKLLLEACLEIIEKNLVEGMQDMGAGGLLCASLEMIQRGTKKTGKRLGCKINVDKIPTKYAMDDCDKLISESQERMLIVSKKENMDSIFEVFNKWDLEYSVVGEIDEDGDYKIYNDNNKLYKHTISDFENVIQEWDLIKGETLTFSNTTKVTDKNLWNTYDSTIGCRTIESNREKNYSIIELYEVKKKLIITWSSDFNECLDTIKLQKFKPLGLINCLNYGHPQDSLFYLKEYIDLLNINCKKTNIPVLGGNVSLYNSTDGASIPPSPMLVMIGITP